MASSFVLYGPAGIGKTEMAGSFPAPLFIVDPLETGVEDLRDMGYIQPVGIREIEGFPDLIEKLEEASGNNDVSSVVIETLRGVENVVYQHTLMTAGFKSWSKFFDFDRGPDAAQPYVADLLLHFKKLLKAGKSIVLTAHCDDKQKSNAQGADYQRTVPDCMRIRKMWNPMAKWFQNIFFLEQDHNVQESDNPTEKAKVQTGATRSMLTSYSLSYESKNRFRLPAKISMGFNGQEAVANLQSAIKESKNAASE